MASKVPEWAVDDGGMFIGGDTQGGKTVFANFIHHVSTSRCSIFFNLEPEPYVRGRVAHDIVEVADLIDAGVKCIDYQPVDVVGEIVWTGEDMASAHEQLVELLFALNDPHDYATSFTVVTDECHEVAPNRGSDETSLHRLHKRGEKRGIKAVSISQDYSSVPNKIIRQSDYMVYLGPPHSFEEGYLRNHNLPYEQLTDLEEHEAGIMDDRGDLIDRFRTPAEYAGETA